MNRVICCIVCGCLLAISFPSPQSTGASTIETNVADLQTQLQSGLKCRRPEEFAYIRKVVAMVSDDQLPLELVMATFQWTRKNPRAKDYPFFYFQRALRERAKKLGIIV
ncbi:MAG: hypothetical protein O3C40_01645 [Planctomycetota bacterium]|nr:hypothetical protein [Planctomycetota bacterium]